MISLEEARRIVLEACRPLGLEKVDILAACGRVIGEDVYSPRDIPARANSAKDGYALRSADVQGASVSRPVELKVTETIAAGKLPRIRIGKGQAARIMTGAPLPAGADAVIRMEDTRKEGRRVHILVEAAAGLDIRLAGLLHGEEQEELNRIQESISSRFLYGSLDQTCLRPSPEDPRWIDILPAGYLQEAGRRIQAWSDPTAGGSRPEGVTPAMASRALLELYALAKEVGR